jgi:probable phosphoglycerate mutase
MPTTDFIVIRHGETAWNAQSRIQGHLDSPLNDEGLAQALMVGERMAHQRFDVLYSSDLGRALQTAQPIADRTGHPVVRNPRLRERHLGVFQGLTSAECERLHPAEYQRFHARDPDHQVPGGESIRQVFERVSGEFTQLAEQHPDAVVVVVTHGGILDALYRFARGMPLDQRREFPIYNASLNFIRRARDTWSVERWGDIGHLTRDAALDDF